MALSLILSFPITLWPMRQDIIGECVAGRAGGQAAFPGCPRCACTAGSSCNPQALVPWCRPAETLADTFGARQLSPAAYYALTYLSLLLIYLLAVSISSAYQVGCTAAGPATKARIVILCLPACPWLLVSHLAQLLAAVFGCSAEPLLVAAPAMQMVGLIGSVTGTTMAFLFPGMLALRDAAGGRPFRAFGWALILAGILLTVVGIATADEE